MKAAGLTWRLGTAVASAAGVCVFLLGYGTFLVWQGLVTLPHTYDQLRRTGASATAQVVLCAPGIGGGRGTGCRLRLVFAGQARTWAYPEDSRQFEHLAPGAPVAMLVDPADPDTAYTRHDVEARTNAGSSPPTALGVALGAAGLAGLTGLVRLVGWRRRLTARLSR